MDRDDLEKRVESLEEKLSEAMEAMEITNELVADLESVLVKRVWAKSVDRAAFRIDHLLVFMEHIRLPIAICIMVLSAALLVVSLSQESRGQFVLKLVEPANLATITSLIVGAHLVKKAP